MNSPGMDGWLPPSVVHAPEAGAVHVFRISVDRSAVSLDARIETLDDAERLRASRFHFLPDALTFATTRAALRELLGRMLGISPQDVRFQYTEFGKPFVEAEPVLRFSVSHSHEVALIAIAHSSNVGVDVERMRHLPLSKIEMFLSQAERERLRAVSAVDEQPALFRCWTRKEAYVKGRGLGLSFPLDRFSVSVDSDLPAILSVDGEPDEPSRWEIHDLHVRPGYCAALAAERPVTALSIWDFGTAP